MQTKITVIVVIVGFFLTGLFFYRTKHTSSTIVTTETSQSVIPSITLATPTPFPFQELTIPYLRTKSYESSLGPLTLHNRYSAYTSYITSYTSDGLTIKAQLTKPTTQQPDKGFPAIIFIHGYIPPAQYQTTSNYNAYVDYLAKNGFVVFKIDLRGHGASQGEASGAYYSSEYISDVLHAYSALEKTDFVNAQAIGLWGHSMAGNVAMRSIAAKPTIPAIVIWAGAVYTYTDLMEFGIDDNSYRPPSNNSQRQQRRQELNNLYGQPTAESTFWKQVAPINYVSDIQGAIQIHHAINDDVVSINYSRNLNNLLTQTPVTHELYEYQSGGHNIQGASFTQAMQRTVEFFNKHLR